MIEARTSVMIDGYLWDQPATDAAFRDGWYRTGDLGIMPENGRVIVVGCTDNMLNIGGVKIVPEPLETQIKALGGINDAVLIAVPGRRGVGELMVVFECAVSAVSQAIEKAVTDILSPVGRIFHVRTDPRLPVTATGKVRRDVLRDRLSHS